MSGRGHHFLSDPGGEIPLFGQGTGGGNGGIHSGDGLKGRYLVKSAGTVTFMEYRKFLINGQVEAATGKLSVRPGPSRVLEGGFGLAGGLQKERRLPRRRV